MKSNIMLSIALCLATVLSYAGEKVLLWPEGKMPNRQDHQIAAMSGVANAPDFKREQNREPFIEWLDVPQSGVKSDVCMILISGGAYECTCDDWLIKAWHKRFSELGVRCVNLVYRTPRPHGLKYFETAWADGQRAVRLVRSEAQKRGFNPDKIGTMSMSAGSHLATLLATSSQTPAYAKVDELDDLPCHINWACAFAIAYAQTDGLGKPNTRDGDAIDVKLDDCFKFDSKTCPMWMAHGGNDIYSPGAAIEVYRKLRTMNIPAEVHLYPDRGHGAFGLERAIEFMRQMKFLGELEPEVDVMQRYHEVGVLPHSQVMLWPEGRMPDKQEGQCTPYIEWFIPSNLTTKSIQIIYSGGAYTGNAPYGFEVVPVRNYLNSKGMAVVTMQYRTPRPKNLAKHTTAWQDLQRAIRIVRRDAAKFGLNGENIGIMGSSAGGHLTLMGATSSMRRSYWPIDDTDKLPCNVQWAIAIYPAYVLTDGVDGGNKERGNLDSNRLVPEFSFDKNTPPIFFIHGDSDVYSSMGSIRTWQQLRRMGVQGELHTLATRHHCFQLKASPGTGSYSWIDQIWGFLSDKKFNK